MKVFVFSKTKQTPLVSRARRAGDGLGIEVYPYEAIARTLPALAKGSVVYLDMAGLSPREQARRVGVIPEHPQLLFGVLDFTDSVADPASLFHRGALDYLGKSFSRVGLSAVRVNEVLGFAHAVRKETVDVAAKETTRGWADIKEGHEYPFFFLFVEVDDAEEMKKRFGHENLVHALDTFRAYVERGVTRHGGKLWLWQGFGGMALFPHAEQAGTPLVCTLRLLLWRPFFDVEESPLPNYISFRMAMSVGSMVYREKRTGGIVSEALNSVFHLGQRFTEPGQVTLTGEVLNMTPDVIKDFCLPVGVFEGKKIYRLRAPLFPHVQRDGE